MRELIQGTAVEPPARWLYRQARRAMMLGRPTWSGVYERYGDVPRRGGFTDDVWVTGLRRQTERAIGRRERPVGQRALLSILVATIPNAHVLDFGGGMGLDYVYLRHALGPSAVATYTVIEVSEVCRTARELLPDVRFLETPPPAPFGPLDVLYIRSALQYAVDPLPTLGALLAYGPRYALLTDLSAGNVPTHLSAQLNVPGSSIPCWFLDWSDVDGVVRASGYQVLVRVPADHGLPRQAVPATFRLERYCNVLLGRR